MSISYKEGLFVIVTPQQLAEQETLALTVAMPTSYHSNNLEGLFGNHDGVMENDMKASGGAPSGNIAGADNSQIYNYANTCEYHKKIY